MKRPHSLLTEKQIDKLVAAIDLPVAELSEKIIERALVWAEMTIVSMEMLNGVLSNKVFIDHESLNDMGDIAFYTKEKHEFGDLNVS